ncbi:heme-copper oxidase family protein [Erythrobacter aurantius]|uniref:hypothetical protein n=1 Tax=Erythrobacter aurantius TaxID=2909249 RepID=UPI00207A0953|nr:hypothetical protein [Erythrobacter aurantius]
MGNSIRLSHPTKMLRDGKSGLKDGNQGFKRTEDVRVTISGGEHRMQDGPSTLSLIAAAFYALVLAASLLACRTGQVQRQHGWQVASWAAVAVFFLVLIVSRIFNVEEALRADLREWLQLQDLREGRRSYQGVIIAIVLALFAALGLYTAYHVSRRMSGRRNIAVAVAIASCGVMVAVIAMRSISLHAMDTLLYGPLKLNWTGDLGASAVVLGAAVYYTLLLKGRIASRR